MKKVFGLIGIIVGTQFIVSLPAIADAPDTLWTKTYGGTDSDYGNSVQKCAGGGFVVAGWTESFGAGSRDVWLIRISDVGVEERNERLEIGDYRYIRIHRLGML